MATLLQVLSAIDSEYKEAGLAPIRKPSKPYCRLHLVDLVNGKCEQCQEDKERGYQVLELAGRCANGSQLDSGTLWHALRDGEYWAVCGAKPGRRSAGWSAYTKPHQPVTCPRCIKKLEKA